MASGETSSSASISSTASIIFPLCHCLQPTTLSISWTDANPGRRFFKCDVHGFLEWSDKDLPCQWQKRSLLEARDKIRRQAAEIKALREAFSTANAQLAAVEVNRSTGPNDDLLIHIEEIVKAQIIQSDKNIRNCVFFSCAGFFVATVVLLLLKI